MLHGYPELSGLRHDELVAHDEAGGLSRAGVDVLDAAQERLVVLQGRVAVTAGEELHHAHSRHDPIRNVA